MQVFNKSKHIIKRATLSGTALALILTPTAALAHSSHDDNGGRSNSRQGAVAQQQDKQKQRNDDNNRFNTQRQKNRDRQKQTCAERQTALNQRASDAKAKYTKKLTGLNIVYSGVQTYVSSGDVTVENYDALNAKVTADQTGATNAVNAIAAPQLNCDDSNGAAAMSDDDKTWHNHDNGTNDSINAARQAINVYRHDLNTLFEAAIES